MKPGLAEEALMGYSGLLANALDYLKVVRIMVSKGFFGAGPCKISQLTRLDAVQIFGRRGGMADAVDSKSTARKCV